VIKLAFYHPRKKERRREIAGLAMMNEEKRPHPWDTHHQFPIKTLLSKKDTRPKRTNAD